VTANEAGPTVPEGPRPDPGPEYQSGIHRRGQLVARRAAEEVRAALRPFTIPNGITLVRLGLVPFFILAVIEGNYKTALVLFVVAGISDGLDGALARMLHARSLLGAYLDPIADKVLLISAFVTLTWPANPSAVTIPKWLTVFALSRDVMLVLVALVLYLGADVRSFPPSWWGKVTTVVQILVVAVTLLANIVPVADLALGVSFWGALALTLVSGVDYIRRASLLMEEIHHESRG
jgi:cardiolipin synthase (CMP-forming)